MVGGCGRVLAPLAGRGAVVAKPDAPGPTCLRAHLGMVPHGANDLSRVA